MNREQKDQQQSPQAWTAEKLRSLLHDELTGDEVLVISNREPYIHEQRGNSIILRRPASGLVTAVEPVMRIHHAESGIQLKERQQKNSWRCHAVGKQPKKQMLVTQK